MRAIPLVIAIFAAASPVAAGTVIVKSGDATPSSVSAPAQSDKLLAPGDADFVIELIDDAPQSVIQLAPPPRDDCYGGSPVFGESGSGPASSATIPCP